MNEHEQALLTQIVGSVGMSERSRAIAIRNLLVDASAGAAITDGPTSERFRNYQWAISEIDAIIGA